jgi:hypothetical protein
VEIAGGRMINTKRTTQGILQEEMLRERAAALVRAGERLAEALEKLNEMERDIAVETAVCQTGEAAGMAARHVSAASGGWSMGGTAVGEGDGRQRFLRELNGKIHAYNLQREHVRTRYYYLIVIREALGMIHHQRLEEIYRIPPKKHSLPEG